VNPSEHYLERADKPGAPSFRARVNLPNGKMVVTRVAPLPDAPHARVTLQLLKRVGLLSGKDFVQGPPQDEHAYKSAVDVRASYSLDLDVPADLAELKQVYQQCRERYLRGELVLDWPLGMYAPGRCYAQ
jgi:hypothetical protein